MPLFLFFIFSGFPCENFPIWIQTDISYNYPQVEFVCEVCVGKVLISLIERDRWDFMIPSCGN